MDTSLGSVDFLGRPGWRGSQKRPVAWSMQPTIERNDSGGGGGGGGAGRQRYCVTVATAAAAAARCAAHVNDLPALTRCRLA